MTKLQTTHIRAPLPKREWLLRCADNNRELSMCSICVHDGSVEIITSDNTIIELDGAYLAEFRDAFQAAIELAETDLAERQSGIPDV